MRRSRRQEIGLLSTQSPSHDEGAQRQRTTFGDPVVQVLMLSGGALLEFGTTCKPRYG